MGWWEHIWLWNEYFVTLTFIIRGHIYIQAAMQNVNLMLYFLTDHPPPIMSSVAIEKYFPNKPLNVTDEDTLAMSPYVNKKLLRLHSFKSQKLF